MSSINKTDNESKTCYIIAGPNRAKWKNMPNFGI